MREDASNYSSGEDYALEFLGYHFSFGERDFEERSAPFGLGVGELAAVVVPHDLEHPLLDAVVEVRAAEDELAEPVDE